MLESLSNLSSYVNKQSCSLSKLSEMVVTSYRSLPNHEKGMILTNTCTLAILDKRLKIKLKPLGTMILPLDLLET